MKYFKENVLPILIIIGLVILGVMTFIYVGELFHWFKTPVSEMTVGQLVLVIWIIVLILRR